MRQARPRHRYNAPIHNINGQTLYQLRREAGLSLRGLVMYAATPHNPVSRATISRAELGQPISPDKLQGIADALTIALGRTITIQDLLTKDQP